MPAAPLLEPFCSDTSLLLERALKAGKKVLWESRRAPCSTWTAHLPFVTSSNPVAGAPVVRLGVGPASVSAVLGVTKAYTTPWAWVLPTEIEGHVASYIRETGKEYGVTTGRAPNRWLDIPSCAWRSEPAGCALAITQARHLANVHPIKVWWLTDWTASA